MLTVNRESTHTTALTLVVAACLIGSLSGQTASAPQGRRPAAKPAAAALAAAPPVYFPDRVDWQKKTPAELGMDPDRLAQAVQYAVASENPATKDLAIDLATTFGGREPFDTPIGPIQARGSANGLVIRRGYVAAEWGDTRRVDMTFSVTDVFVIGGRACLAGRVHPRCD